MQSPCENCKFGFCVTVRKPIIIPGEVELDNESSLEDVIDEDQGVMGLRHVRETETMCFFPHVPTNTQENTIEPCHFINVEKCSVPEESRAI